jgi:hypothetical protein
LTYKDCRNAILLAERLEVGEADPDDVRKVRAEMRAKWVATRTQTHSGWRGRIRRGFLGLVDRILQDPGTPAEPDNAAPYWLWKPQADARLWAHDREVKYYHRELAAQADLLRDILGDPFQPVRLDPNWRTETVLGIAGLAYAQQTFEDLPILADALEDAGCDNQDVLTHLRSAGPHVRGCWPLDLLLGKG